MSSVHPFTSVAVTEYVPIDKLERSCVVDVVFHRYEIGAVPPVVEMSIDPFVCPAQVTSTCVSDNTRTFGPYIIVIVPVSVQPFASVTTLVYVPKGTVYALEGLKVALEPIVYGIVPPVAVTV